MAQEKFISSLCRGAAEQATQRLVEPSLRYASRPDGFQIIIPIVHSRSKTNSICIWKWIIKLAYN